jgi:transposase
MTDAAKLVKKLDFITRKAVAHVRDAKACVVACERIIVQLRRKEAIGQLGLTSSRALTESVMTVSKVLAGL